MADEKQSTPTTATTETPAKASTEKVTMTAEESTFRNKAYDTISKLANENAKLKNMAMSNRKSSLAKRRTESSSVKIAGLQTLNPQLGNQKM
jgi:hypothetical protein